MQKRILSAFSIALASLAPVAGHASDGTLEISQACVATGCFPGDAAGFPVTIAQSGSYRLTSNLTPTTAQVGIDVTADDVAIDLGGFAVKSTNACSGPPDADTTCAVNAPTADGIHSSAARTRVRSGAVVGMGGTGIELGVQAEVEDVSVAENGDKGIQITSGRVSGCSAFENYYTGIYVMLGPGLVERSTASRNGYTGVLATNAVIAHSQSGENRGAGIVAQGVGSLADGNVVYNNVGYGITAGAEDGYTHNVINGNHGGNAYTQLPAGTNLGGNVCGNDAVCP